MSLDTEVGGGGRGVWTRHGKFTMKQTLIQK